MRLSKTRRQQERLDLIRNDIEERYLGGEWAYETGKAWDAIHRSLTGGVIDDRRSMHPVRFCIWGGTQLYSRPDYIVSLVTPENLEAVAKGIV